jgi:ABC-type proline/glycine betaine transport system permease subunit
VESVDTLQILAGAVPAAAMALLADGLMSKLERKVATR